MMLEAAPTPCRRTGFHISSSSACAEAEWMAPGVVQAVAAPAAVVQVGSIMIMSPGLARSIAAWTDAVGPTWVGALPPTVTVTVSIDCLPLAAVMTNSPQRAAVVGAPYSTRCCTGHTGTLPGTCAVIWVRSEERRVGKECRSRGATYV